MDIGQLFRLDNKTAFITGASSGIGKHCALLLAQAGAKVAVGSRRIAQLQAVVDEITQLGGQAKAFELDVTNNKSVVKCFDEMTTWSLPTIVINNAGIGSTGSVADGDDAEWHRVLDINVVGTARVSSASLPYLRKSKHAAIVNVSSLVAMVGLPQRAIYSASKGAIYSLTLAMASDHVREGIRVNCVLPGTADTPWVGRLLTNSPDPVATEKALKARQPMGRLVTADEVAFAICYLASPLASSTTGTALGVDGGSVGLRVPQA